MPSLEPSSTTMISVSKGTARTRPMTWVIVSTSLNTGMTTESSMGFLDVFKRLAQGTRRGNRRRGAPREPRLCRCANADTMAR